MMGPCMCGAMDCITCRGDEAINYVTPCGNCDATSGSDCECGAYEREEHDYYPDAGDLH